MKSLITRRANLHKRIIPIVNNVVNVLNLHYLQNILGKTNANCMLWYIIGLILIDGRVTMNKISQTLKCCTHDAFWNMLSKTNLTSRQLDKILISFIERVRRAKVKGWIIIDDTSIVKKFAKSIGLAGYAWCGCDGRCHNGIHFVTLFWTDGKWCFPVGFRIWKPRKNSKGKEIKHYKTRIELAKELIIDNLNFCQSCEYLTFDSWYCSNKMLNWTSFVNIPIVSSLKKNRNIIFKKRKIKVSDLAVGFRGVVNIPEYGEVFIYNSMIGHKGRCLVSTDTRIKFRKLRKRYKRRWPIETFFRILKQNLGLNNCQARKHASVINHISIVFLSYVVLEFLRFEYGVSHGKIKTMMQNKFYEHDNRMPDLNVRRGVLKHVA